MKKLKKLSLHNLSQAEMTKKEMSILTGGSGICRCKCYCSCSCGCNYSGEQEGPNDSYYGGSSTTDNHNANFDPHADSFGDSVSGLNGDTGQYYGGY